MFHTSQLTNIHPISFILSNIILYIQAKVRKQVLQTMFFYRASAETSIKRWGSILDDNFQLVLPITPYRSFPPAEVREISFWGKDKTIRMICVFKLFLKKDHFPTHHNFMKNIFFLCIISWNISKIYSQFSFLWSALLFKLFILCFVPQTFLTVLTSLLFCSLLFQVMAGQRRVNGVEAMIVDTTSLSVMVQSIGIPNKDGEKVSANLFEYVVLFLSPFIFHIHCK